MTGQKITDSAGKTYIIKDELGRGSFGIVYLAHDKDSQPYGVKMIGPIDNPDVLESFKREIDAASRVKHQNVLHFVGQGEHKYKKATYFFSVTEYCPEGSYKEILAGRAFSLKVILSEFQQILAGLEALHQHVVHRDIKPENILIVGSDLKVADLGLSKSIDEATKTLTFKGSGTPRYMAPEIWERRKIIPASDLYAVGIMLFEAITGRVPFEADDLVDLRDMHLYEAAPRVKSINQDVPDHIDGVIKKLLEKNSAGRYQTAREVAEAIKAVPPSSPLDSTSILRTRIRQSHDAMESRRLEEKRVMNKKQQTRKRIEHMEQQLISQIDQAVQEINKGLEETQIISNTQTNSARYSFGGRTLHISFFQHDALYDNNSSPSLREELKKHHATHAGVIYIEENGENREGWNVVLIQKPENPYGEWLLIESEMSALTGRALKYSPTATDENLLSENLAYHWMHTMHTWNLKDKILEQFDIERILDKFIP